MYAARLPVLPDLSHQPTAVRTQIVDRDNAARGNPTSAQPVGALCLAYHANLFYELADRCYTVAEDLSRDWHPTYYRALVQSALGDSGGLTASLRRVVEIVPDFSPAWWQLGDVEFKTGHYDRAESAWQRAQSLPEPNAAPPSGAPTRVRNAPISAYATVGLARLAMLRGAANRARELLEPLTAKTPRFGPAFRMLGSAYGALGRPNDQTRAVRDANRLPAYDPYVDPMLDLLVEQSRSSTFLLQQAASVDLSTNAPWREYLTRRAVEYDPDNADALFDLASMLRVLGRFQEALQVLEKYRRLVPGDALGLAAVGRCLSGMQRYAEAESSLREALKNLDDANIRYELGVVLDRTNRVAEAIAEYERTLERNPNHKDALNNLGVDFVRQHRWNDAVRIFERLLASDPDNAEVHTNLGVVFLTEGARDRAAQEFRTALELNPDQGIARDGLRRLEP